MGTNKPDIEKIKKTFERNGYSFSWFNASEQAKGYLLQQISGKTVGIGGSMTIKEMNFYESLKEKTRCTGIGPTAQAPGSALQPPKYT